MKREINCWKWDEKYNYTELKLGLNISKFPKKYVLEKNKYNPRKYHIVNDIIPDYIIIKSETISSIFFEKDFLKFNNIDLWDLEIDEFKKEMNKYFEPCEYNFKGDVLIVLFRDIFTGIAEIKRNLKK